MTQGYNSKVLTVFESGTHSVRTGRDGDNILRVFDGSNNTGGEHELLPSLADVDNVDTVVTTTPDVICHHGVGVTGSSMDTSTQHHLDVILLRLHNSRDVFESSSRHG
jgi:hypothetical protein